MIADMESVTAKLCALGRAWHSRAEGDEEKLYDDYLAYDLLGADEYEKLYQSIGCGLCDNTKCPVGNPEDLIREYWAPIPLSRALFTREKMKDFIKGGNGFQYVISGAGSDTYSFRCRNRQIRIFELDHPATQEAKQKKIRMLGWKVPENVTYVPVDFESDSISEKLDQYGYSRKERTFFSLLGVSYYLDLDVMRRTFQEFSKAAKPGDLVVFDYPEKRDSGSVTEIPERVRRLGEITGALGEEMKGSFTFFEIFDVLSEAGFSIDTHYGPEDIERIYFQNRRDGMHAFENVSFAAAVYVGQRKP